MNSGRRLSDLIQNNERSTLEQAWSETAPAAAPGPLPAGAYDCRILAGELSQARTGTPSYKLTLEVLDGENTGGRIWHDLWLTQKAMARTKRDLAKLGIREFTQLDQPLPRGITVRANVVLRRQDDGREHNRVRDFEVIGIEEASPDPFAPVEPEPEPVPEPSDGHGFLWKFGEQPGGPRP